jgi:hypothetical protein
MSASQLRDALLRCLAAAMSPEEGVRRASEQEIQQLGTLNGATQL